jgi:hypothetical protein
LQRTESSVYCTFFIYANLKRKWWAILLGDLGIPEWQKEAGDLPSSDVPSFKVWSRCARLKENVE